MEEERHVAAVVMLLTHKAASGQRHRQTRAAPAGAFQDHEEQSRTLSPIIQTRT